MSLNTERAIDAMLFATVDAEGPEDRYFETAVDLQGREAEDGDWITLERFPPRGGSRLVDAMPILRFVVHRLDEGVTATLTLTTV